MLWTFSIYLEAVAILPQLFLLQRTGETDNISAAFMACLGAYRALYLLNWIYRWMTEPYASPILSRVMQRAGLMQRVGLTQLLHTQVLLPTDRVGLGHGTNRPLRRFLLLLLQEVQDTHEAFSVVFSTYRRKGMNRLVCSLMAGESKFVLPTTSEVA